MLNRDLAFFEAGFVFFFQCRRGPCIHYSPAFRMGYYLNKTLTEWNWSDA